MEAIIINGMKFVEIPEGNYKHDYRAIYNEIKKKKSKKFELEIYRELILNDLWFFVYFVMKVDVANHKFWIDRCNDVQDGPETNTLDLWAREHGKSTIITIGNALRETLYDKVKKGIDSTCLILGYSEDAARKFLLAIKTLCEQSLFLQECFPDVLFTNPERDSVKWTQDVLFFKRESNAKEGTFECSGLIAGMKTGGHYRRRIYDDVETEDIVGNPDQIEKLKKAFDLSENLGMEGGTERVIGTYYHHAGLLTYLEDKKDENGNPIYKVRKFTATEDGTFFGRPVLLSEERLRKLRTNKITFACQQLMNPTAGGVKKLDGSWLVEVDKEKIPNKMHKVMLVDWAGESKSGREDSWAIMVLGIVPYRDDLGLSDVYILDLAISPFTLVEALKVIVGMYLRNGRILKVGVEKVGASTVDVHVANELRAKANVHVTIENGNLVILSPKGRNKQVRIENNLSYPLQNGKIKVSKSIPREYIDRLRLELDRFPVFHDDGIDGLSYVYDVVKDYRFPPFRDMTEEGKDSLAARLGRQLETSKRQGRGWMIG